MSQDYLHEEGIPAGSLLEETERLSAGTNITDRLPLHVAHIVNGSQTVLYRKVLALKDKIAVYITAPSEASLHAMTCRHDALVAYDTKVADDIRHWCTPEHVQYIATGFASYIIYRDAHEFTEVIEEFESLCYDHIARTTATDICPTASAVRNPTVPDSASPVLQPSNQISHSAIIPTASAVRNSTVLGSVSPILQPSNPTVHSVPPPGHQTLSDPHSYPNPQPCPTDSGDIDLSYELDLPKFNGDYLMFPNFINKFDSLLSTKSRFSNRDKYRLLRKYTEGFPNDLVCNIPISPDGYSQAREVLFEMYDKPLQHQYASIDKAFLAKPAGVSPKELRKYLNFMSTACATLYVPDGYHRMNLWPRAVILSNIPMQYHDHLLSLEATAGTTLGFLETITALRVTLDQACNKSLTSLNSKCPSGRMKSFNPHSDRCCILCQGSHRSASCTLYTSAAAKRGVLMKLRPSPCWICFKTSHRSKDCTMPGCSSCGQDHALFLCASQQPHISSPEASYTSISSELTEKLLAIVIKGKTLECTSQKALPDARTPKSTRLDVAAKSRQTPKENKRSRKGP